MGGMERGGNNELTPGVGFDREAVCTAVDGERQSSSRAHGADGAAASIERP